MNKTTSIPFGLRFVEKPVTNDFPASIYDEEEDISIVIGINGERIPSVENYKSLSTKTFTEVKSESTDDDQESINMIQTATKTAATEESSDSDDHLFSLILSTKTDSYDKSEQTDEDPGIDSVNTNTATKVVNENTDND